MEECLKQFLHEYLKEEDIADGTTTISAGDFTKDVGFFQRNFSMNFVKLHERTIEEILREFLKESLKDFLTKSSVENCINLRKHFRNSSRITEKKPGKFLKKSQPEV